MDKYGIGGKKGFIKSNPDKNIRYLKALNFIFHEKGSYFIKKGVVKKAFEIPSLETAYYENFYSKTMTEKQVKRILDIVQDSEGLNLFHDKNPERFVYRVIEQFQFEPMSEDHPDADRLKKQGLINIFKKEQSIHSNEILAFASFQLPEECKKDVLHYSKSQKPKVRVIKRKD